MFRILRKSVSIGVVTEDFPAAPSATPSPARGCPEIKWPVWRDARPAAAACPTGAIKCSDENSQRTVVIDLAACTACGLCADADPSIRMTNQVARPAASRAELRCSASFRLNPDGSHAGILKTPSAAGLSSAVSAESVGRQLQNEIRKVLGRSLHIREVDAGSCNGCEIEIINLNNPVYDAERFGVHFVASPRHADMLLVTGPVTRNMELALKKTYDAMPEPGLVVAVGACGCSGGIFGVNYATRGAVDAILPVDVYVPGCPPTPLALLQGILLAIGRLKPRN